MPHHRQSRLDLNFDGLTDSVTNLVGALILLIVLLIAVTQPRVAGPPPDTIPDAAGAQLDEKAAATLAQLLKQVELLRAQTMQFRQHCSAIGQEVDEIKLEAEEILEGASRE